MGADSYFRWVKTDEVEKYDWTNGGIYQMNLPEVPEELNEDTPSFDNIEHLILGLLRRANAGFLFSNNYDYVFDLGKSIDNMIRLCRLYIHELIWMNDTYDKPTNNGMKIAHFFYNDQYEWDGELAEDLCRTLRHLKYAKEKVLKHEGWSLIVELEW